MTEEGNRPLSAKESTTKAKVLWKAETGREFLQRGRKQLISV